MDKLKSMFQGKRGKIFLVAAGVVAIIAFVVSRRKAAGSANLAAYPTYQANTPEGATGGQEAEQLVGQLARDMGEQFKQQAENQQDMILAFNSALANTQSSFSQMFMAYSQDMNAQMQSLYAGMNSAMQAAAEAKVAASTQKPIVDDLPGSGYAAIPSGFYEPASAGSSNMVVIPSMNGSAAPAATAPTPARTPEQNQAQYLADTKAQAQASGNTGLANWANQMQYTQSILDDPKASAGAKKWAAAEQAAMTGKKAG